MGLFSQIAGQALTSFLNNQDGSQSPLLQIASHLIESQGGVDGLIEKLQQGGLAEQVSSWVSTGANQSIDASQLTSALGEEHIAQLAEKFGISGDMLSNGLAQVLPQLIDHVTPNGSTENSHDLLSEGLGLLSKLV